MPSCPGHTLLRFTVQMGEVVLCNSRLVRIESVLDDGKVRILDLGTNLASEVSIADLRAWASIAEGATIDAHLEAARGSGEIPWQHAKVRECAVAELIEGSEAGRTCRHRRPSQWRFPAHPVPMARAVSRFGDNVFIDTCVRRGTSGSTTFGRNTRDPGQQDLRATPASEHATGRKRPRTNTPPRRDNFQ